MGSRGQMLDVFVWSDVLHGLFLRVGEKGESSIRSRKHEEWKLGVVSGENSTFWGWENQVRSGGGGVRKGPELVLRELISKKRSSVGEI